MKSALGPDSGLRHRAVPPSWGIHFPRIGDAHERGDLYTGAMQSDAATFASFRPFYPDAISTRLVFRIYGWITIPAGLYVYLWPNRLPTLALPIEGMPWGPFALLRTGAAMIVGAGLCAATLAIVDDPRVGRRALVRFAIGHLVVGLLWFLQWHAILSEALPPIVGWAPLLIGSVLLYIGLTAPTTTPVRKIVTGVLFVDREFEATDALRSQYAEQISRVARQEERARLARDLHDAVKQQLFVIQTAAATVEARLDSDPQGARQAVDQIRAATREAVIEMQATIEQLQAAPVENVGLTEALKKQCEALGFRTGAQVDLKIGELPPSEALPPGAQEALFRGAQEALANIARHARASRVDVVLEKIGERLELSIVDNGAGFDPRTTARGMGIENMTSRAREIRASFALRSRPGGGTSINFSVPCSSVSAWFYGRRALGWTAFLAVIWLRSSHHDFDPMTLVVAGITAIMAARHAAAFVRIRRRTAAA